MLYAGQYHGGYSEDAGGSCRDATVVVAVEAGATFGASFKYTGSYEAMLWKTDAVTGRLHLYRNKVTDANFNIGATVGVVEEPYGDGFADGFEFAGEQGASGKDGRRGESTAGGEGSGRGE